MLHSIQFLKVVFTPISWQLQLWSDLHTNTICHFHLTEYYHHTVLNDTVMRAVHAL